MSRRSPDAEEVLERATMALFEEIGWKTTDAYDEVFGETPNDAKRRPCLGRVTRREVVLRPRLRGAMARLNPGLPPEALHAAAEELCRDRSAMGMARANREVYQMLRDGVPVTFQGEDGSERYERVQAIDWENRPGNNEFLMVQQLWVSGEIYDRRADLVGFVNGLPLLFGELKAHHRRMENAYYQNLSDYKDTIPHLLWYNAFIVLSNGSDAVMGTVTSEWEHFAAWKKIEADGRKGTIPLETLARGTCRPGRFLDIVENYVLYQERRGGLAKIVAKYHQYFGVEAAIEALRTIEERHGQLGVFWHTQGSGKSLSMVFFSQKVLRKEPGNWTFVVVTDRVDLDDQIYKNFSRALGVVTETEERVRSQSGEHLKQLLREDHRYVFTLIQKFQSRGGQRYEELSDRSDIIVMADEAHRSQYDVLALNMRDALPNAAFIAFTATPLIEGEEQETREVFGDYVSVYSYKDSAEDHATVRLYYENRVPEVQLTNWALNEDVARMLEDAEVDDAQEQAVAQIFRDEYQVITRIERLDKVAADIVDHFINRGFLGKAMVVSVDKLTTVRMHDLVQAHWRATLEQLRAELATAATDAREALAEQIAFMETTDMAVVVSQEQGEVEKFRKAGLDITPHRRRMVTEDLDEKFKDPDDPFRLVFVCAMWRTGFDVPSCSTIYLDRPMRNHTLMQTIARANRVFGEKPNGIIVDYVGIFRDLQHALAIYGTGPGGQIEEGEEPAVDKGELVEALREALAAAEAFCSERGVEVEPIIAAEGFRRIALMGNAVERLVVNDDLKAQYLGLAGQVDRVFKAILPDRRAGEFTARRSVYVVLAAKIRSLSPEVDVDALREQIEGLLDVSVEVREYVIGGAGQRYDLSAIDFEALQERFAQGRQHTETERLRGSVAAQLEEMIRRNPTRAHYREQFEALIEEYNAGSRNIEELFAALVAFVRRLNEEDQRAVAEQLSEEELAVFDILTQPGVELSDADRRQVKRVVRTLLEKLKAEKLVLDWREREHPRAGVKVVIRDTLWDDLPEVFSEAVVEELSTKVFLHVYDKYQSARVSVYVGEAA